MISLWSQSWLGQDKERTRACGFQLLLHADVSPLKSVGLIVEAGIVPQLS